jgi:hypothetical protein
VFAPSLEAINYCVVSTWWAEIGASPHLETIFGPSYYFHYTETNGDNPKIAMKMKISNGGASTNAMAQSENTGLASMA